MEPNPAYWYPPGSNPALWAGQVVWSLDAKRVRFTLYDESKHVESLWEITTEGRICTRCFQDGKIRLCSVAVREHQTDDYYLFVSWKNPPGTYLSAAPGDICAVMERNGLLRRPPVQITAGPLHF
jgi:hypothetical protein